MLRYDKCNKLVMKLDNLCLSRKLQKCNVALRSEIIINTCYAPLCAVEEQQVSINTSLDC